MKIGILSLTSGWENRGVETVVRELASRWGVDNEVVVYQAGKRSKDKLPFAVKVIKTGLDWEKCRVGDWRRKFMFDEYHAGVRRFTKKVLNDLAREKVRLVMPMNGGWQSLLVRRFCSRTGAKMLVSGQAGLGWNDRWNLLVRPDVFVALSERNARWARSRSWGVRVEVVPNGVDLARFRPTGKKLSLKLARPVVLCVASGDKYKRVDWVIAAVKAWGRGSLLLVGGSKMQEERGRRLLSRRFKRIRVSYEAMPKVYPSADVFTLMSEASEAFGIAYLEAMASGLPVVAPDDSLRREILGEKGVLVRGGSVEELRQALETAGVKGRVSYGQALKKYGWDRIADEYLDLMRELVNE